MSAPAEVESQHVEVVIVGAGFSGLGMARSLKQHGIADFLILERSDHVGGTWQYNTYPGCRCDVPSHLYSFSFAPNPEWSHTYSAQPEIQAYLSRCVDEFGIRPHLRTGVELHDATWSEERSRWELETSAGSMTATVLVSGMGPLTEPKLPDVPGIERFEGKAMHSARWDHGYDLRDKTVASIGTGASAIQYVPEIQSRVAKLYVVQRTAPWVMPHSDRAITDPERSLYRRLPIAQRIVRSAVYLGKELLVLGFVKRPALMGALEKISRAHMRKHISDPDLLTAITPEYQLGCKRILPSNRWYPALAAPNVELVTGGLIEVRPDSILTADGVERRVDALIFGTGFHVTDLPLAAKIRGRGGQLLEDLWGGSPRAYLGTSVPGFPSFFMLLGPNTGLGHSSMIYMIESQIAHVTQALLAQRNAGASGIEVRQDAHDAYNRAVDARMRGTVWDTGGCLSFYLDATGRNATLWPDWTWRFRRLCTQFDAAAYRVHTRKLTSVPR